MADSAPAKSPTPGHPEPRADDPGEGRLRMTLGRDVVALSLVAAVAVGAMALSLLSSGTEASGVIGLFTTLVGTVAGMVFGAHVTQKSATAAVEQAQAGQVAALFVDPSRADEVLRGIDSTLNGNPRAEDF